jgi:hypothetical protein
VNVAVLVLRARPAAHRHYRAPTIFPVLGVASCAYLASPWSGRDAEQYRIAAVLLVVGLTLWAVNWFVQGRRATKFAAENLSKSAEPPAEH